MLPRRALNLCLAILVLSVFITPWQRELYVGDETKYGQVVREMRGGAFFLPTLHGTPFTHKPPLHFWLVDLLTYPLGLYSIWAFVLPSLAAYVLLLWLVWKMGGSLAAFVCGSSLMIWGSAQTARMDVSFTALLVLAAMMIRRFIEDEDRRALLYAGIAIGVATLIKGPMAPVIGIGILVFERLRRKRLPRANYLPALAAAAIIPLLWFVPAMRVGGDAYTREVIVKQTAGRAVGSWVHKAAPWFYVTHAPGDLFPWFFLAVVALIAVYRRHDEDAKFYVSWILAVFVPYTLMSSKLDIYMMALLPPVALLIACLLTSGVRDGLWVWAWRANILTIGIVAGVGAAGLFFLPGRIGGPEAALLTEPSVRGLFITMIVAAVLALIVAIGSRDAVKSTLAAGLVPVVALLYVAIALLPIANELASARPLVRAIQAQQVPPQDVTLYFTPHLWSRDMPRELERVTYMSADDRPAARVVVTSRKRSGDIAPFLTSFRKVGEFRMIGKWFDVYRR
jgi:4-amino-4-deoxy-L-arabinose transferase-like glycosyltransferase